jgi:hypothetical protein
VAVAAPKRLVDVEEALHPIIACRDVRQARGGIPEHVAVDDRFGARLQAVDVDAEHLLGPIVVGDLEAGLLRGIRRQEQQHAAVPGARAERTCVGERDPKVARGLRVRRTRRRGSERARNHTCNSNPGH